MANSLTRTLLENMLLTNNPSIDVKDPIIKDLAINFGADIIESVETRVKQISDKFSSNYLSNLSSDELDVFALNVKGMSRNKGSFASGHVHFIYKNTNNINIPANTLVSTQDGVWEFYTTTSIFLTSDKLKPYLNPMTNEYQIRVPVQALNTGTDYNLSAYRLTYIKSSLTPSPLRIENRQAISGGKAVESDEDFVGRIETAVSGFNLNTKAGIVQALRSVSGVTDIQVIKQPLQNAFDVYFLGDSPVGDTVIKTASGSFDRTVTFNSSITPIRFVDLVVVDGTALNSNQYSLSSDRSQLVLNSSVSLVAGSTVVVSIQYNSIAQDVRTFMESYLNLFGTRWNVKEPTPFTIEINVVMRPLTSGTSSASYYQQFIYSLIKERISGSFLTSVNSLEVESLIFSRLPLTSAKVSLNNAPSISIPEGYYPYISSEFVKITVL